SRDWSLVGFGATPQGLKSPISALFKVRLGLFFSAQLFHRLLDTTLFSIYPLCLLYADAEPVVSAVLAMS
ncbi:MAG: hypothetical protein K2O06_14980, partial [Acetatifactor sp.]|nr:hypothetical protein [Acetatifactor sp.]